MCVLRCLHNAPKTRGPCFCANTSHNTHDSIHTRDILTANGLRPGRRRVVLCIALSLAIPHHLLLYGVMTSCTCECTLIKIALSIRDIIAAEATPARAFRQHIEKVAKADKPAEAVTVGSTWRWKGGQPFMRLAHSKLASDVGFGVPAMLRTLCNWSELKLRWVTFGRGLAN
jgi:hypothetical protein